MTRIAVGPALLSSRFEAVSIVICFQVAVWLVKGFGAVESVPADHFAAAAARAKLARAFCTFSSTPRQSDKL